MTRVVALVLCCVTLAMPWGAAAQSRTDAVASGFAWPSAAPASITDAVHFGNPESLLSGGAGRSANPVRQRADGSDNESSAGATLLGALLAGGVAAAPGVLALSECDFEGSDCLGPLLLLAVLQPAGVAFGAHVGNRRQGSLALDMLVSFGTIVLGLAIDEGATTRGIGEGNEYLFAFAAQLGAVVLTERRTGRRP